jgi:hypothetical protein
VGLLLQAALWGNVLLAFAIKGYIESRPATDSELVTCFQQNEIEFCSPDAVLAREVRAANRGGTRSEKIGLGKIDDLTPVCDPATS